MGDFKSYDLISDEHKINIENNKIKQNIEPFLKVKERLAPMVSPIENMAAVNSALISHQLSNSVMDVKNKLSDTMGLAAINLSSFHIDTSAFQIANSVRSIISSSIKTSVPNVLTNFSSALEEMFNSPFIKWLGDVDFSPLFHIWENWNVESAFDNYDELHKIYLRAMYDAKWFPYAGWIADVELFAEVNEILGSSRGMSKRCEKRIDRAILSYYTKTEIKHIKKQWRESDLEPHVKKALGQTLEAYLRKEYALVIPFLATMWEGIIKSKGIENTKKPQEDIKKLVDENGYDDVFSDFYNNMIIGTCYSIDDVVEGVPNRHGVAHSWYTKYPNQKAALNAILLTDFLINLKPKEAIVER
ncbi:MAG: hypothetical protein NC311_11445 [Muribaculaceae bacterium]|nr:hypothetical protein [Muribaculaceae bacterium]MCM1399991.1 hypothetical protein [Clostridium sp.]MCM1460267.1 hypothetical protein [Bacteroides sp.]